MRLLVWMAALTLLTGCNAVVTKTPMFTQADEAGAPALRPGLWRFITDPDCKVDESLPLAEWPECGGGVVLKPGTAGYYDHKTEKPVWTVQPFVIAGGTPRIAQAQVVVSGDVKLDASPYAYAGLRSTKLDPQGRITAFAFWVVQCGEPSSDGDHVTTHPLPGMDIKPGDPVCATTSADALRKAAKASEAWSPKPLSARWLRDASS